jgi:molecular chaperone Hsp33
MWRAMAETSSQASAPDRLGAAPDIVAGFSLAGAPVNGRIARLGPGTVDPILQRHVYPRCVANLLGEALTLAALVGAALKFDGRLMIQAEGDGPVRLLSVEYATDGGALRGFARVAPDAALDDLPARVHPVRLLGEGALRFSIDQGPDMELYQGIASLEGDTLAACAESWFTLSQQIPTRLCLAVAETLTATDDGGPLQGAWVAGGILIQRTAGDDARGDTEEDWSRAQILLETVTDAELIDQDEPAASLLYKLFHEEDVAMAEPSALIDRCSCSGERLAAILSRHDEAELAEMADDDGMLRATCQFCSRRYEFSPRFIATRVG